MYKYTTLLDIRNPFRKDERILDLSLGRGEYIDHAILTLRIKRLRSAYPLHVRVRCEKVPDGVILGFFSF